jgi:hypothetical protein
MRYKSGQELPRFPSIERIRFVGDRKPELGQSFLGLACPDEEDAEVEAHRR